MPSPFPGMDPYLESPMNWRGFHNQYITHFANYLNEFLPQTFVATVEERLYVIDDGRQAPIADFAIIRKPASESQGGTAVLERVEPDIDAGFTFVVEPVEVRESFIEIVAVGRGRRQVITVIEVLSPTNKIGQGRAIYQAKQEELWKNGLHLLEIDLLRDGWPTVGIPPNKVPGDRLRDYIVCLHRVGFTRQVRYWPVGLRDPLPRIPVPLTDNLPDVAADLQAIFNTVYDRGAFARLLEYGGNPIPPLSPNDAAWADALLKEKGLR